MRHESKPTCQQTAALAWNCVTIHGDKTTDKILCKHFVRMSEPKKNKAGLERSTSEAAWLMSTPQLGQVTSSGKASSSATRTWVIFHRHKISFSVGSRSGITRAFSCGCKVWRSTQRHFAAERDSICRVSSILSVVLETARTNSEAGDRTSLGSQYSHRCTIYYCRLDYGTAYFNWRLRLSQRFSFTYFPLYNGSRVDG